MSTRDTHTHCRVTASQWYQPHRTGLTPSRTGQTPLGSRGVSNPLGKATAWAASWSRAVSTDLLVVVLWHVALSVVHHCYLLAVPGTETRSRHKTGPASAPTPQHQRGCKGVKQGTCYSICPFSLASWAVLLLAASARESRGLQALAPLR